MSTEPELVSREELAAEYELQWHESPSEATLVEAEREANRVLGILRDVRAEMEANERVHRGEVSDADRWLARRNDPLRGRETFLMLYLEALAPFVEFFGKAKSRDFPRGRMGYRTKAERLEITDPKAAAAWAIRAGLTVRTEVVVSHAALAEAWRKFKEVPEGCQVVPEEEMFYAKPLGVS